MSPDAYSHQCQYHACWPVIGHHGLLAHMQSCFKYTCIRLTALPTPNYPNLHLKVRMKWQVRELHFSRFILCLLLNYSLICPFYRFPKKKKKNPISKHPYPSIMTTGLDQASWLTLKASSAQLWLLHSTLLEGGWPDPSSDPQGHQAHPSALSASFCHVHVAGMSWAVKQDSHQFINITVEYYRFFF